MNPAQALAQLRAHPRTFLTTHYVKVEANPNHLSGTTDYGFGASNFDQDPNDPFDRTRGTAFLGGLGGFFKGTRAFLFSPAGWAPARLVPGYVPCEVVLVAVTSSQGIVYGQLPATRLSATRGRT